MSSILFYLYIGPDRIPASMKSGRNFKFKWNSFVNKNILIKEKIIKNDSSLSWLKQDCVSEFHQITREKRFIKIGNQRYEVLYDEIQTLNLAQHYLLQI